jgi:hypothetical protein
LLCDVTSAFGGRFSEVFRGFQRFSEVFRGFQRFSEVFRGFQRFSEVFRGFQRFSEVEILCVKTILKSKYPGR